MALFAFCLSATSGLLAMSLYATVGPREARARLGALRDWTESRQDQAIVTLSLLAGLAGLWLVARSPCQLV